MPAFHLALRGHFDVVGAAGPPPLRLTAPTWVALAGRGALPADFSVRHQTAARASVSPDDILRALAPEACLSIIIDPESLTVRVRHAVPLHYLRLADATVKPLPPDSVRAQNGAERPLQFSAGDAYLALSPGVLRIADSPALARFIHLRDYFNAEKMAGVLLDHLAELHGSGPLPADISLLVLEAR